MPGYQINWDLKTGKNALGLLNANGNDLVKAMKKFGDAKNQQGSTGQTSAGVEAGTNEAHDAFAKEMVAAQAKINELEASQKNVESGRKLVEGVKNMMNKPGSGVTAKIDRMQKTWVGMTDSRELQNADLKKIVSIRQNITDVLEQFSQLRHNGVCVFSKRIGVNQGQMEGGSANDMQGAMFAGNSRGVYVDFVPAYSDLRQNLIYIRENISNYSAKGAVTQRFINCKQVAHKIVLACNSYSQQFNSVRNSLHFVQKRTVSERDEKIRTRQNQLSVEAVVGILQNQPGA